jgi:hypothetical protein
MCVLAGYVVPILQNGALKWKKKLTVVRSRAAPCLRCNIGNFGAFSEIWEMYEWQVLLHPPYSPDMSPPDYLFPKLKKPLCRKRFRNFDEVCNEATRVIRRISNEVVLTGIQDLPKRWTATIKHNGDYTEGL